MSKFKWLARTFITAAPAGEPTGLRLAFDIETNGLLNSVSKVHCVAIVDLDTGEAAAYGPDQIPTALAHLGRAVYLTGHNVCGFDLEVLRRLYGWTPPTGVKVVDTLIVSRLIFSDISALDDQAGAMGDPPLGVLRGRHSLEAWGQRLGIPKVGADIVDWSTFTPAMRERCEGDTVLTRALWQFLQPGGYSQTALELEYRVAGVVDQIVADGVPFARASAERLATQWQARRDALENELARQFSGVNFSSREQLGKLLESRGWVPEHRTEKTNAAKIDDDTLESISEAYPEFSGLAEHYILGRRLGQLVNGPRSWCENVGDDNRIHGGIIPIGTPHFRAAHAGPNLAAVPNPKKQKPFATECRALFRAPAGWKIVCSDQAGLQDRGLAHYLARYDGGAYAATFSDPNALDTHWRSTAALGMIDALTARDKGNALHETLRDGAKRFRYAFLYGVGAVKAGIIIADTIRAAQRVDADVGRALAQRFFGGNLHPNETALKQVGRTALNNFEAALPGLRQLRERLQTFVGDRGFLPGLDGRKFRRAHSTSR